jgi:ABC-type lipoprotein release transport system permease subunit
MRPLFAIAYTGLMAILQYRSRSAATMLCVLAVLVPFLSCIGLSKGLEEQAAEALSLGADLYVTGQQFGKEGPVPLDVMSALGGIDGVTGVTPRIVARVVLGKNNEEAVLVGMPADHFPAGADCIEGRLPRDGNAHELVMGTELARRLNLHVGNVVPPFYHSRKGEHISRIVGIFKADAPIWQAHLLLTSFATASAICDQPGLATDLLIYCRPGYQASVRAAIMRRLPLSAHDGEEHIALQATTREDLGALLPRGILHREGIFNLHFLLAFAVGILAILVSSGAGSLEFRRDIGILKATGWQTDEILLRSLVQSALLALAAACLALVLAFIWLQLLNGYWIASVFLGGVDVQPSFRVPHRLTPVPALLSLVCAVVLVMTGTLYSTWRAALVPPRQAMR